MNMCLNCGNEVKGKFCNNSCSATYNNKNRKPRSKESKLKTSKALVGRILSDETKQKISTALQGRTAPWNVSPSTETRQKISNALKGKTKSAEFKKLMSSIAKDRGLGGNTSKKRLEFLKKDGSSVYLQSSYEIEFANILEELDIEWSRPSPFKWVDENGDDHRYYPDFKVGGIYIDTKNDYLAIVDLPKINAVKEQNNIDLRIVTKDKINKEYVKSLV